MKIKRALRGLIPFALLASGASFSADDNTFKVLYRSTWSEGIDPRLTIQASKPGAIASATLPQLPTGALRISMSRSDDFSPEGGVPRAEIVFAPVVRFMNGHEYEIRWSTMIPKDYVLDSQQPEIITQIHQSSHLGSPPVSLILADGRYRIEVRTRPGEPIHSYTFGTPVDDKGTVVNWRLKYRPDNTGVNSLTDLFRNGALVVHSAGEPNAFPDEKNAYLKVGIYKWWWKSRPSNVNDRTMYFGNVEIAERILKR